MTTNLSEPKLYIKMPFASGGCQDRIAHIVEKVNYNFQLKKLFQNNVKRLGKFQRAKQPQDNLKHVKTHPTRFKRGK